MFIFYSEFRSELTTSTAIMPSNTRAAPDMMTIIGGSSVSQSPIGVATIPRAAIDHAIALRIRRL